MRRDASPPVKSVQLHRASKKKRQRRKKSTSAEEKEEEESEEKEVTAITHEIFIGLLESRE